MLQMEYIIFAWLLSRIKKKIKIFELIFRKRNKLKLLVLLALARNMYLCCPYLWGSGILLRGVPSS